MLDKVIQGLFDGYRTSKTHKSKKHDRDFKELEWYPMLYSTNHLNYLVDEAETKEEHEAILSYMYRFENAIRDAPAYNKIEKKIIDQYWEE